MNRLNQDIEIPVYFRSELSAVAQKATKDQGDAIVRLLFYTDPHHMSGGNQLQAAAAIRGLAQLLPLDAIVCGGDFSENGPKEEVVQSQREILNTLRVPECPTLPVKGNHDDNSIHDFYGKTGSVEHVICPIESYENWLKPLEGTVTFDKGNECGLYYYYDIPDKKTRIAMLNSIDIVYKIKADGMLQQNGQWEYAFSDRQVDWFEHRVFDFTSVPESENWKVVIFSHLPIIQRGVKGYVDGEVENGEKIWKIIKTNRKHVVACLFGHVHIDQVLYHDGIPMISTLNAVSYRNYDESPERTVGTVTETAFDLISIDYAKGELRLTRFGAGVDRIITFET